MDLDEVIQLEREAFIKNDPAHAVIVELLEAKREIVRLTDLLDEAGVVA